MSARQRYLVLLAARGRAPLPAAALTLFTIIGVFAYDRNEPASSWAFTALAATGFVAWLTQAILRTEPAPQADAVAAVLGGRRRLELLLVADVTAAVTALFIVYPLAFGRFAPAPDAEQLAAATLAHLVCGACGGALAVALGPARVRQAGVAATAVLGALVGSAALLTTPAAAGPAGVADRLAEDDAGLSGGLLLAGAGAVLLAALVLAAAERVTKARG